MKGEEAKNHTNIPNNQQQPSNGPHYHSCTKKKGQKKIMSNKFIIKHTFFFLFSKYPEREIDQNNKKKGGTLTFEQADKESRAEGEDDVGYPQALLY